MQHVAGSERLMAANSAMETTMQVGAIVGAALAGAVIAGFGTLGALVIDAASFLAAGGLIVLMAPAPLPARSGAHPNSFAEQLSGFRYIASRRVLLATLGLLALPILCIQFDNVLIGPFVKEVLGLGPGAYGVANATYSSGATGGEHRPAGAGQAQGRLGAVHRGGAGAAGLGPPGHRPLALAGRHDASPRSRSASRWSSRAPCSRRT